MAKEKEHKTERQLLVEQLLDQIDFHGLSQEDIFGQDGIIKDLTKRVVERALNAEMDHHLGYEKHSKAGDNSGDSRNGTSKKTIIADNREIEIDVPRDRNGSFEPIAVPKHQKRTPLFNDQIISLYSRGLSTRDIRFEKSQSRSFYRKSNCIFEDLLLSTLFLRKGLQSVLYPTT